MENSKKFLLIITIVVFGGLGLYFTFVSGNTSKYDSETKAYRIEPNETTGEDSSIYYPEYYYKVEGKEYVCKAKTGSSKYPSESKNKVYYKKSNPEECKTEYEKSTGRTVGILLLVMTAVVIFVVIKGKNQDNTIGTQQEAQDGRVSDLSQQQMEQNIEQVEEMVNKVQIIIKRVILGFIIFILSLLIIFDTAMVTQTLKAKNYEEATATRVKKKENTESSVFDEYIYEFIDKNEAKQQITITYSKDDQAPSEIKIKYDENNPKNYYESETQILGNSGIIWYFVKIIILILLIVLFINKKLLAKLNFSARLN